MTNAQPSLRKKFLVPLLLVLIATFTIVAVENTLSYRSHLTNRLQLRATRIANLIRFIAGSAQKPAELQHLVGVLGGEEGINLIAVLAGDPARVVASTRMALLGKTPRELRDRNLRGELGEALTQAPGSFRYEKEDEEFDYFQPLSVATQGTNGLQSQQGAVIVSLDTRPLREEILGVIAKSITSYFIAGLLLAAICWVLLDRHVLRPVKQIATAVSRFHVGNESRISGTDASTGEFMGLISAWNRLIDRLEREGGDRTRAEQELRWKTAFLEAQVNSSLDGIIVVNEYGWKILQNQRTSDLFKIPRHIADDQDDESQIRWIMDMITEPVPFVQKVIHLYSHRDEIGRDELELKDGTVLDRYSSPVVGKDGKYYGRTWTFRDITAQKLAAAELLESKRFLQSTLDALSSHIAILDEHGTIMEVNSAWSQFAAESNLQGACHGAGDNYLQLCDAASDGISEEAPALAAGIRAVIAGQRAEFHMEYPCHSPSERRWFAVQVTRFAGDGPVRVVVAHENISERKRAESLVRQSEERYRSLIDNARDAIFTIAADGKFTSLNPAAEAVVGISRAEWIGRSFIPMVHPEDVPLAADMFRRILKGEHAPVHEWRGNPNLPHPALMEMTLTCQKDEGGKIIGLLGIGRDVTERKRKERELRESEERFRGTFEQAAVGIAHISTEGRFLRVNDKLCSIVGYAREEMLGMTFADVTVPEDLPAGDAARRAMLAGAQSSHTAEKRYRRRNGDVIWINLVTTLERTADGEPKYFIAVSEDITARKQAEFALEKAHRDLVDASRRAGMAEVATGVLHNVGNVLNSVNTSISVASDRIRGLKLATLRRVAEMLRGQEDLAAFFKGDPRGAELPAFLGSIVGMLESDRGAALRELDALHLHIEHINEIVAMQQSYATGCGVLEVMPITGLIEDALRLNAGSSDQQNLQIIRDYAELPPVPVDRHKVLQILVNLIRNAKNALDEGPSADKRLTLRLALNGGAHAKIAISDNGIGIPAENLTRIFEHGFTTRKNGHGFGLHSSANTAREMGGSLTVESNGPGLGATFTLALPLQPANS